MLNLTFILLLVVCYLNLSATVALRRSVLYEPAAKIWQMLIIWLVPVFGAVTVLYVLAEPGSMEPSREEPSTSRPVIGLLTSLLLAPELLFPETRSGGGGADVWDDWDCGDSHACDGDGD